MARIESPQHVRLDDGKPLVGPVLQVILDTYAGLGPGGVGLVTSFNDRERPAGTKFSYASVETQVLGLVLTRAIGRPVAEYLEQFGLWDLDPDPAGDLRRVRTPLVDAYRALAEGGSHAAGRLACGASAQS